MCQTFKTDFALFSAALIGAMLVLGANLSLADILTALSAAN